MADTIPIKIPYSFVEYKGVFEEPIFAAFVKKDWAVTRALYLALQKWGLTLEQIVLKQQTTNVSEIQISFNLPRIGMSVHLSLGNLGIFLNNPDWNRAGELVEATTAAVEAAKAGAEAKIQSQQLSLGMHLTLKGKTRKEVSSRFVAVSEKSAEFLGKITGSGFSVYGDNCALVVDTSNLYTEALFVRIMRTHGGTATLAEMTQVLEKDEKQTFALLGVHEDA
ncbi:MAG TPA: hypothetical protein VJN89_13215 [Candidatus Acidoferrum sp.]|nr:hypothetical protein [Candidatus Acidoferrum sp.]